MTTIQARIAAPIDVELALRGIITNPRFRDLFIDRIEEIRDRVDAANDAFAKRDVPFDTFVNGQPGKVDDITFAGSVTFVWRWVVPIVMEAKETLEKIAPVYSGRYQRSFRMLVNGVDVDWNTTLIQDGVEVILTNVQPYARKLEVRAADGILESVGSAMRRRFGNFAKITFQYIDLSPPVWVTQKGKAVPHPAIRIAPANAYQTARAQRHGHGRRG